MDRVGKSVGHGRTGRRPTNRQIGAPITSARATGSDARIARRPARLRKGPPCGRMLGLEPEFLRDGLLDRTRRRRNGRRGRTGADETYLAMLALQISPDRFYRTRLRYCRSYDVRKGAKFRGRHRRIEHAAVCGDVLRRSGTLFGGTARAVSEALTSSRQQSAVPPNSSGMVGEVPHEGAGRCGLSCAPWIEPVPDAVSL